MSATPGYVSNAALAAYLSETVDRWNLRESQMIALLSQPTGTVGVTGPDGQTVQLPSYKALFSLVQAALAALASGDTAAQLAVSDALAFSNLSRAYALSDEDVEVTPGEYSAKHWAAKAQQAVEVSSADKHYRFVQSTASDSWVIAHNLGKYPSVTVVDSAGSRVFGNVSYDSLDQITITFSAPFSGEAYCN